MPLLQGSLYFALYGIEHVPSVLGETAMKAFMYCSARSSSIEILFGVLRVFGTHLVPSESVAVSLLILEKMRSMMEGFT